MSNGASSRRVEGGFLSTLFENRVMRPVRVCAREVTLDGLLSVTLGTRTLDEMNLSARAFVTLFAPLIQRGDWPLLHESAISINKASILFVLELPDLGAQLESGKAEPEVRHFARSMLRLRVADYTVEGYVHTLHGGDALARLNLGGHPFLAMSPATITG